MTSEQADPGRVRLRTADAARSDPTHGGDRHAADRHAAELESDAEITRFADGSSTRDALGALPSASMFRRRFGAALTDAIARRMPLAVLVLELGDAPELAHVSSPSAHALLAAYAMRLSRLLRSGSLLHHSGPTSFTCVLEDIPLAAEFNARMAALVAALAQPFSVHGQESTVRARIGVSTCPSDGLLGEALRKRAAAAAASLRGLEPVGVHPGFSHFSAQGD